MSARSPRVFISYTHDGSKHRRRVLRLAERLRRDEIDVRIDGFVPGTPIGGWPAWMEDELRQADFIVLICTEIYHERYQHIGDPTEGRGSRWEASLVRDLLYMTPPDELGRFIPILPDTGKVSDIPLPLRVRVTRYSLSDYEGLLEHLSGEHSSKSGIAASQGAGEEGGSSESPRFSPSIREQYLRINVRVEELTTEQYGVIEQLHGQPRALISGTPGSGKTLVGAEKAIRLAHAGIKTLFLCHNPLLAEWVRQLTGDSAVDVRAFEDLIRELVPAAVGHDHDWSSYSQPTTEQLSTALEVLLEGPARYQAVVVDEGQDFADDWWQIVEACLPSTADATLYVFFDERQSLVPQRMNLPALGWPLTLSKNCRNGGRVYEVMRLLSPGSPLPDEKLRNLGHVRFFGFGTLSDSVTSALEWCDEVGAIEDIAAVLGGGVDFENSVLARGDFAYGQRIDWQDLVRKELHKLTQFWSDLLAKNDLDGASLWTLKGLSDGPEPTRSDIEAVAAVASGIASLLPRKQANFQRSNLRWKALPVSSTGAVNWRLRAPAKKTPPIDVLNALRCDAWTKSLPVTETVSFAPHRSAQEGEIPLYSLGEIKGLERNAVLLVMQGDVPQLPHHVFVGVSRARALLAVVGDQRTYSAMPSPVRSKFMWG